MPFGPAQGLPKMETIASLLQKQGYVTGGVGCGSRPVWIGPKAHPLKTA
jgi:hypothetical protein